MTLPFIFALGSVIVVSLISLVGLITLSWKEQVLRKWVFVLVSLAVGALLGDAFIHLIPEAFVGAEDPTSLSLTILGGMLIFFVFEKFLHWHHHQGIESTEPTVHPVGSMILVSDSVHNFIDGLLIAASYMVSIEIGIATTVAVILHEIPQEIGDFGVLLHAGYTKMKALLMNFVSAPASSAGALLAFMLSSSIAGFTEWLVLIAAGGFIYVALSDLIPELHKTESVSHSVTQFAAIIIGISAMVGLLALEPPEVEEDPFAYETTAL